MQSRYARFKITRKIDMSLKHIDAIVSVLGRISDQNEKFRYLVDLGRKAAPYPEDQRKEDFLVKGCISQLWLHPKYENGLVSFDVDSDAAIPKGIAAIMAKVYRGALQAKSSTTTPNSQLTLVLNSIYR